MHPDFYNALAEITEEVVICGLSARVDPILRALEYDDEEIASMLRAAIQARESCKAEAYYCRFVLPERSYKGATSNRTLVFYIDPNHNFVLDASDDVDRIVNKELIRRTKGTTPTLSAVELQRILSNWLDQAISGPGQLSPGVEPSDWVATHFLEWWGGQVGKLLQRAEIAFGRLQSASHSADQLEAVAAALADLRASVAIPPSSREPA